MQNRGNICVLAHGEIAHDSRVLKTLKFLSRSGFSVWVFYPGSKNKIPVGGELKHVHFSPEKRKKGCYYRILAHTFIAYEYNYLAKKAIVSDVKFDYIYVNDLPSLSAGLKIKKSNPGSKLIYDSHEIFVETLNQSFPGQYSLPKRLVFDLLLKIMRRSALWFEKKALAEVDYFITVNESLKNYFENLYGFKNIRIMMNCPELETKLVSEPVNIDYRQEFEWEKDAVIFIYQGALTQGRGLELLLKSMRDTPYSCKLIIIGSGALEYSLKDFCSKYQLNNRVKFIDFIPNDQLKYYTKTADVGINLLEPFNLSKAMASPNKLFEYIHAGIPVLASDTEENRKVLEEFDLGFLVTNTRSDLCKGLAYFLDKNNKMSKIRFHEDARKKYCWENQISAIDDILNSVK